MSPYESIKIERNTDLAELLPSGYDALRQATEDGMAKGYAGQWKQQTVMEHLRHIDAHITAFECGDRSENHLSHVVCRAVMAYALMEKLKDAV